jgi:hypothetical protein
MYRSAMAGLRDVIEKGLNFSAGQPADMVAGRIEKSIS